MFLKLKVKSSLRDTGFYSDSNTFFCFSPAVMLFTFAVEMTLMVFTYARFQMTKFGNLVGVTLILLGIFQFTEYRICTGESTIFWAQIGFVAITLLPALGIHLISLVSGNFRHVRFAYALAAVYIFIFLFAPKAINGAVCGGNYIIFNTSQELYWTYGIYYFGFLLLGIWDLIIKMKTAIHTDLELFSLLAWMLFGYFSFMVPTGFVYWLVPEARAAVPSVMCGFALIFALILALVINPKYHKYHATH